MKKIAIIESSSKIINSNNGNLIKSLNDAYKNEEYTFIKYNENNLAGLFENINDNLSSYQALIIDLSEEYIKNIVVKYKELIDHFISAKKGVLVLDNEVVTSEDYVSVLPDKYQYKIFLKEEDEQVIISDNKYAFDTYEFIIKNPNNLVTNKDLNIRTKQYIKPKYQAYYTNLMSQDESILLVNLPIFEEKIVLTTVLLEELFKSKKLLDNLLNYLINGVPRVAFVYKEKNTEEELDYLKDEIEITGLVSSKYDDIEKIKLSKIKRFHDIYVFSKEYSENIVLDFFEKNKKQRKIRIFYYKQIMSKYFLSEISNYKMIDTKIANIYSLILSSFTDGFWNNNFYNTIDILLTLDKLNLEYKQFLFRIKEEYTFNLNKGLYNNSIVETSNLIKIQNAIIDKYQDKDIINQKNNARNVLINLFDEANDYQKICIIESLFERDLEELIEKSYENKDEYLYEYVLSYARKLSFEAIHPLILLRIVKLFLLVAKKSDKNEKELNTISEEILNNILEKQDEFGVFENDLNLTAEIIKMIYEIDINLFSKKQIEKINEKMKRSVIKLKKEYQLSKWNYNILLSANAILVLNYWYIERNENSVDIVYNEASSIIHYKTVDFLLKSLETVVVNYATNKKKLEYMNKIEEKYKKNVTKLNTLASITTVLALLLVSYYIYLALEDSVVFKKIMSQSLMWVPIAIGLIVTPTVNFISRKILGKQIKTKE